MQMILIDSSRLNITLYPADMVMLGLTFEKLDWNNTRSRTVISNLLGKANEETGFRTNGNRLLIEAAPTRGGGCLLRFTVLSRNPLKKRKQYHMKRNTASAIFEFEDADAMMEAVRRLYNGSKPIGSRVKLYHMQGSIGDCYYLMLPTKNRLSFAVHQLLCEYGRIWGIGKYSASRLEEYGSLISSGSELSQLAACLNARVPSSLGASELDCPN